MEACKNMWSVCVLEGGVARLLGRRDRVCKVPAKRRPTHIQGFEKVPFTEALKIEVEKYTLKGELGPRVMII